MKNIIRRVLDYKKGNILIIQCNPERIKLEKELHEVSPFVKILESGPELEYLDQSYYEMFSVVVIGMCESTNYSGSYPKFKKVVQKLEK